MQVEVVCACVEEEHVEEVEVCACVEEHVHVQVEGRRLASPTVVGSMAIWNST